MQMTSEYALLLAVNTLSYAHLAQNMLTLMVKLWVAEFVNLLS